MRTGNLAWTWALLAALSAAPAAQEKTAPSTQELIQNLGDDSYMIRRDAEAALAEMGQDALDALRQAAENSKDEEVRWRARRLVQRIEQGSPQGLRDLQDRPQAAVPGPQGPRLLFPGSSGSTDLDDVFERVFGQLEREFGMDIPRQRFFQDDFFRDLNEQMGEIRRRMEDSSRGQLFGPGWNFDSNSQSVSVQIGPDGVKLEIRKTNEDGETETEVYEAPDMEAFREKYPELAEKYMSGGGSFHTFLLPGGAGSLGVDPDALRWFSATPQSNPRPNTPGLRLRDPGTAPRTLEVIPETAVEPPPPPPEGKRLGVLVRPVSPEVADFLGLDQGLGLLVDEVEEDSLAQDLGILSGDIVTEIGGVAIHGVENVQEALGAIDAGETVHVVVNRKGEHVSLEAPKRKSAGDEGGLKPTGQTIRNR